jgi:type I restriction enzyme, S subunit
MRQWSTVTLGNVMHVHIDAVPSTALISVNLAGVYGFGRGLFQRGPIAPQETTYKNFHRLNAGDFVISSPKAWEGALARIPDEMDGWYLSPVFPTFRATDDLDTRYLEWYCKRETVWRQLQGKAKGMGARRESVSPAQFLSLQIPLPPLPEQQAIVSRLNMLGDKTRQLNEHLDSIEQKTAALFLSLHHKLSGDRVRRLGDVLELQEESVPVRADSEYSQVGVRGFGGGLFPKAAVAGTETSYRAFNRLYADALVLSQVKGWEGALALCPPELAGMYVSPEYRTFRCVPGETTPGYIGELVRTPWFWGLLQEATRGVGARRERTRPEQFLNIELPMPPQNKQHKVVEILNRQTHLRTRHATIRQANDALIPATLERVFSGAD